MAAGSHSEKPICIHVYLSLQVANLDDQTVSSRFFKVLNRLEGVLK